MNNIEMLEGLIEGLEVQIRSSDHSANGGCMFRVVDNEREYLKALELSLEIAKGEAHVARLVKADLSIDECIKNDDNSECLSWIDGELHCDFAINCYDQYYITFNGDTKIPTPAED